LTSDLEREVQAAHVISRSSVDETSLRGSLDQRRSSTVKEPPKEVEVIVHEVRSSDVKGVLTDNTIDSAKGIAPGDSAPLWNRSEWPALKIEPI
jgi:hypothetical protein